MTLIEYILGWATFFISIGILLVFIIQAIQSEVTHREDAEIYRLAREMAEHAEVTVDARIAIIDEMGGATVGSQKS